MSIIAVIVHFITLAAVITGSEVMESTLWAANWWGALSMPAFYTLAVLSLLLLPAKTARYLSNRNTGIPSGRLWRIFVIPALSMALMALFRFRHTLTPGLERMAGQAAEGLFYSPGSFIPTLLNQLFYRFLNGVFLLSAADTVAAVSILAGGFFTAAALSAGRMVSDDNPGLAALLILSGGYVCSFFGAGSNITIPVLLVTLHLLVSIRYLSGSGSLITSAGLLLLALFSDPAAIYLLPGFIYLVISGFRSVTGRKSAVTAAAILAFCWAGAEIMALALSKESPALVPALGMIGGAFEEGSITGILAGAANGVLIMGPGAAAAVILLALFYRFRKKCSEREIYLSVNAALAILLVLSGRQHFDSGMNWNTLFAAGPALY
ncbi:MAG: hypothetical protein GF417_08910, partial [Candidatus Latescibacteria bacterium]|nr:hypothetical protein [bacterium]MBD3424542.1 hypothetical protein [Candidatus Latescibacterota bacterium]